MQSVVLTMIILSLGVIVALQKCGEACKGGFLAPLFVSDIPGAETFVQKYTVMYLALPTARAATAYDAMELISISISFALKDLDSWQFRIFENRDRFRVALEKGKGFKLVS